MQKCKRMIQAALLYGLSLILVAGYPLVALADSLPVDTTTTTPAVVTPDPVPSPTYTYNPTTQHWDTSEWQYNPVTGHYDAVAPVPAPAVSTVPEVPPATDIQAPVTTANPPVVTDKISGATSDQTTTNATIDNTIGTNSQTGSAGVLSNTTAGNATTGTALAAATLTNIVNSAVNTGGGSGPATFVQNITGNVYGDIMLYPAMLAAMLQQPSNSSPTPTDVTTSTTNAITNNVNLNAASGAATVKGNTTAGNATTGAANAVASVMNIINSIVAANKSFIGTVNIYGNLNGDILVAPDFIPQLLASNAGATPTTIDTTNTTGIANNINLAAASGAATVNGNTSAGNATTGKAGTNLVLLNLTGQQIVASNSLLVFVNVLGTWVGMIVNAPVGATAAELGSGVTSNTSTPGTLTTTTNNQITNNIDLAAQSGDATVSGNTQAGNATTGNATSSAMILNLANSSLGLANWFGVLFINVFGSWNGSFGVDTANGNPPASEPSSTPPSAPQQAIAFVAHVARSSTKVFAPSFTDTTTEPTVAADPSAILGTTTTNAVKKTTHIPDAAPSSFPLVAVIVAGLGLAGITWWILAAARR